MSIGPETIPDAVPGPRVDRHASYRATRRFGALDGLRALSVLAVVWHHTSGQPGGGISERGYLGVDFFFAISGFLITTLLLREKAGTGGISLRRFYLRRTLRIFPLYYAVLAVYVVLVLVTRRDTAAGQSFLDHLPAFATYTSNWFVDLDSGTTVTFYFAWSLATEEQFYLFWPPLLTLLLGAALTARWPRRNALLAPAAALVLLIAADQIASQVSSDAFVWTVLSSLAAPILMGALAALALHDGRGFAVVDRVLGPRTAAPIAAAVLLAAIALDAPELAIQALMVVVVTACCIQERTPLHPVLGWRPLAYLGEISYGIYLMHMLAANGVRPLVGAEYGVQVFAATVPAVVLMASISFRYFERPILAYKRKYEVRPPLSGSAAPL